MSVFLQVFLAILCAAVVIKWWRHLLSLIWLGGVVLPLVILCSPITVPLGLRAEYEAWMRRRAARMGNESASALAAPLQAEQGGMHAASTRQSSASGTELSEISIFGDRELVAALRRGWLRLFRR